MSLMTTLLPTLLVLAVSASPLPLAREVRELHREVRELRGALHDAVPLHKAIASLEEDVPGGEPLLLEYVGGGGEGPPPPPLLLRVEQVYLDSRAPTDRLAAALSYSLVPHGGVTWTCRDTETGQCPLVVALSSPLAGPPTLIACPARIGR